MISLLCKDREWVTFICCFSHLLELALKDGLKVYTLSVDESLMHLFYLFKKSSKKHREFKNLCQLLKGQFEMYGYGVRPMCAMEHFVNKYGLYCQHLQHAVTNTKNQKTKLCYKESSTG